MSNETYGLLTGIIFGFLLQRAGIVRYEKQLGLLRFKDRTILKFMFSSICVGMVGIYLLKDLGMIRFTVKPTVFGGLLLGGFTFGIGWALLGYCPAVSFGALGEGRLDALWGILGMLIGAGLFAEFFPFLKTTILAWGNYGKLTLPQVTGIDRWTTIFSFISIGLICIRWLSRSRD